MGDVHRSPAVLGCQSGSSKHTSWSGVVVCKRRFEERGFWVAVPPRAVRWRRYSGSQNGGPHGNFERSVGLRRSYPVG